ncbi:pentapeptide repeats (9 copies) [Holotrichia oblita]|uniref:Pentapeptide repeats (9 copies) n=1 Tax=Holotrichia oblita TaxID=644536 RepID=A0ACB9SYJ8_HOLOL|nr:pentapeptide repeats (9 copies) [Holotrichia oblita]
MVHRDEARRDGIVSIDEKDEVDEDQLEEDTEEYILPKDEDQKEKIKILSDIKVAATTGESVSQTTIETGTTTTAETHERVATTTSGIQNVTGGIATSLGLVDIVVLDENQQYILHNDQQLVTQQTLANEQREYIIPEMTEQHRFAQAQNINEVITSEHNVITQSILNNSDIASTDELVMVLTDHDYNDGNNEILSSENSNIVVLYSHPVDGQQNQFITSQGNLMLNSQTGMLEIRNTEPNSMDSNQDTQIESIEMIQREINSHNIITSSHKETTVPTSSSFAESLPQDTVILESQFSNENLIENQQEATDEAPAEDIDVDRMIAINEKPIEQNIDQEISGHVLVLNDCLSNQEEEPMEIDEECSIQDHQNENQTSMIQEDLTPKAQEIVPAEIQEQVSSKSMPEIGDTIETTVSLTEGISEVSSHPTIQEENQNGDGITTAAIDLESNIDKLDRQHDVTSKDLTSENIEPTEMTSDTHMSDSQTVEHNEEIQVREVEDVVSQEEVNPSISEPVVVETNDLQQVDTEEQLDNDQLMKEQISDDSTAVTNEAQTVELQKIEVQNESIVRENSDNLVHVGADHATGSSEEHIDNLVEHKITQNQDLPMENVEIQEETQQVEQIMQREETTETAEIIAESKKDIQDEQMEQVTEIEKDTNKTEESTCQTEDQSNQVIETHEEQTQSQVEESQVEAPQIEESQVEAPQIEESQIEDSQIEEPHLAESHLEESHIEDSHLEESHLDNSHLEESHLEESHLEESHLEESHLEESHLEESHLEESHLEESHLKESQLEESQMEESQLEEPQIEDTDSYMEINLQTEEVSSQMDDTPSQIDENSVQNESADDAYKEDEKFEEEVSQADEKSNPEEQLIEEGTSSVDENSQSQDSQISHCSSRQEALISEYKKSTSQETKISILNDWEDTEDSQQSDNVSKKAELTVNKLIHDWDDDDEEGKNF